jgi:hypothetical protein
MSFRTPGSSTGASTGRSGTTQATPGTELELEDRAELLLEVDAILEDRAELALKDDADPGREEALETELDSEELVTCEEVILEESILEEARLELLLLEALVVVTLLDTAALDGLRLVTELLDCIEAVEAPPPQAETARATNSS